MYDDNHRKVLLAKEVYLCQIGELNKLKKINIDFIMDVFREKSVYHEVRRIRKIPNMYIYII